MAYKIIVKSPAQFDVKEAVAWYIEQSVRLSKKLLSEIDYTIQTIRENPQYFQKRYGNIRIAFVKTFPYGIYYTIEKDTVFIHAVLHTKQNPKTGIERV